MNAKLVKFGFQKVANNFLEVFLQAGAKKFNASVWLWHSQETGMARRFQRYPK